jgi:predicted metal-dependent hydrolase
MRKYKDIKYKLKRSNRKTLSIYIERDGRVSVISPWQLSSKDIEQVIDKKKSWIYKNLAEWKVLNANKFEKEYVSGESFLYLGRPYQLKIVAEQDIPLMLYQGIFRLRKKDKDKGKKLFKEFYKEKAEVKLPERIELYKNKIGVEPKEIKIMDLQYRWASCTDNALIFNWKIMMAPLIVIDYVVVHELTHLIHKNHTNEFWNDVSKAMPEYIERKNWLRDNGVTLDI